MFQTHLWLLSLICVLQITMNLTIGNTNQTLSNIECVIG